MSLDALLREGLDAGLYRHAALSLRTLEGLSLDLATDAQDRTFDVASVTKAVTAILVHRHLDPAHVVEWIASRPTINDLLAHASGLPAWRPLFAHAALALGTDPATLAGREDLHDAVKRTYRDTIAATPCDAARPTYSDLGFLALGFELERVTGRPLDRLLRDDLGAFAGLEGWGGSFPGCVPTGTGRPRPWVPAVERDLVENAGISSTSSDSGPDDDNAACAGGVTGHAGLRATADGLAALGLALLSSTQQSDGIVPVERARSMFTKVAGSRTAGLDTPSGDTPAIGTLFGKGPLGAAGHLGFTGCSLWMDRDAGVSIALLTDAVTCERPAVKFRAFRSRLHDAAARELGLP